MIIRIVNRDIIPRITRYEEFNSIEELLIYLTNTNNSRRISISKIDRSIDPLWILSLETPKGFLKLCQKDGICGICGGKIKIDGDLRQFTLDKKYETNFTYCDGCGRKIGKQKSHDLIDIFNECANKLEVEYKFHGLPIECGECQGTGKKEIWKEIHKERDDWYPTGKYEPCPKCYGKKEFILDLDLMTI
ncbi:MAG: hypothetical protein ACFFG0_08070 [Candidatus Thorarchaeota archaeon]